MSEAIDYWNYSQRNRSQDRLDKQAQYESENVQTQRQAQNAYDLQNMRTAGFFGDILKAMTLVQIANGQNVDSMLSEAQRLGFLDNEGQRDQQLATVTKRADNSAFEDVQDEAADNLALRADQVNATTTVSQLADLLKTNAGLPNATISQLSDIVKQTQGDAQYMSALRSDLVKTAMSAGERILWNAVIDAAIEKIQAN